MVIEVIVSFRVSNIMVLSEWIVNGWYMVLVVVLLIVFFRLEVRIVW